MKSWDETYNWELLATEEKTLLPQKVERRWYEMKQTGMLLYVESES